MNANDHIFHVIVATAAGVEHYLRIRAANADAAIVIATGPHNGGEGSRVIRLTPAA